LYFSIRNVLLENSEPISDSLSMEFLNHDENQENLGYLVDQFEAMVQNDVPGFLDLESYFKLIDYYEDNQQFPMALCAADTALSQHAFSALLHIRKAHLLVDMNQLDGALESLDSAEIFDPGDHEITLLRAEIYAGMGNHKLAFRMLKDALKTAEPDERSDIFLCMADIAEESQNLDGTFDYLRNAILADTTNYPAMDRIWIITEMTGRYAEGAELHEQVSFTDPYSAMNWFNLGHALAGMKKYESAAEAFEYAYLIDPQMDFAYLERAACLKIIGKFFEAGKCFLDAATSIPELKDSNYLMASECFMEAGDHKRAKKYQLKSIKLSPENDAAFFSLAFTCYITEKYQEALNAIRKAIYLEDGSPEYFVLKGKIMHALDNVAEAEQSFKEALQLEPEVTDYWLELIAFYIAENRMMEAAAMCEESFGFHEDAEILFIYASINWKLGNKNIFVCFLWDAVSLDQSLFDTMFHYFPEMERDEEVLSLLQQYIHEAGFIEDVLDDLEDSEG
jgi:tetratricopeptide (TPR) repeat protein